VFSISTLPAFTGDPSATTATHLPSMVNAP
jgi:hypothetical protein